MSRGKDSYIGRLHSDIGMVPSDSGIFFGVQGGYRNPQGNMWAIWAHVGGSEKEQGKGRAPPSPIRIGEGGRPPRSFLPFPSPPLVGPYGGCTSPLWLVCFPSWPIRPISFARGARNPFRWPNKYPVPPRNTFGIRISSSYISIFTSRPFRDSSSCP